MSADAAGPAGVKRFADDVLSRPNVTHVILLEGINDISYEHVKAEQLIAAYKETIAKAHARNIKVIGCTMTPFGGSSAFSETGEAIRSAVNEWIRTSGAFDAVVDFDEVTRDRIDPRRFRAEADSPDLLHPGDGGYRLMANAFNLAMFR